MKFAFLIILAILVSPMPSDAAKKKSASKRAVAQDSAMRVLPLDPYYPVDKLPRNYEVEKSANGVMPSAERDQLFLEAGLSEDVKGWDQFEKDILYMRVKNENLTEVAGRYPLIPSAALSRLKRLIAK